MVVTVSRTPNVKSSQNPTRPPLLPSETGTNVAANRRPRPREVTSRYLSTSSSSPSSTISTMSRARLERMAVTPTPASAAVKRSHSAERRRPATPRPNAIGVEMSTATKMLVSSKRCLSVSFQGESFSMPKSKSSPSPNLRKATPERKRTTPGDQQPWPSRSRQVNSVRSMNHSVDLASVKKTMSDGRNWIQNEDKLNTAKSRTRLFSSVGNGVSNASSLNRSISTSESTTSETESVCSDNNCSPRGNRSGSRGVIVPARFMQETSFRLRRAPDPSSPLSRSNSLQATVSLPPRVNLLSRGLSPMRSNSRPSTPSRLSTPLAVEKSSPSRGMASPNRVRNATVTTTSYNNMSSGTSILCFGADVRRGKVHENKIGEAHLLRMLYNQQLQWRFANARAETALSIQQTNAERNLYDVWRGTSELRMSVSRKRLELARMILKSKLTCILEKQMLYLDEWAFIEKDHSGSLLGAIESLKASTLRLPIAGGVMTNIKGLKDAMCSALDVLQAMASPICFLLSKVEQMNSLLTEMARVASSERRLLGECYDFVSDLTALQVGDCSLRTHILQLKRVPSSC